MVQSSIKSTSYSHLESWFWWISCHQCHQWTEVSSAKRKRILISTNTSRSPISSADKIFRYKQKTIFRLIVFNWNHFEMRLLNLRNIFYCGLFVLILVVFFFFCVLFLLSLGCGKISPLAFWQQLWKAVITGDTVTRLSIPIRGRGKSPEEGQRWNLAET